MSKVEGEWKGFIEDLSSPFGVIMSFTIIFFIICLTAMSFEDPYDPALHRQFFEDCLESASDARKDGICGGSANTVKVCNRVAKAMARDIYALDKEG